MTETESPRIARTAPPLPAGLVLSPVESTQRLRVFAEGGRLASVMRLNEQREWPAAAWLREVWLWVLWLWLVRGYRAESTVTGYAQHVGHFADWVRTAGMDYTALTPADIDEWQKSLYMQSRHSAGYRRLQLQAVRSFYDFRKTRGLGPNVIDGARGPRKLLRTPRKYSPSQLRALFAAARQAPDPRVAQRDEVILLTLYTTGLRCEELSTLRLDQLELSEKTGTIRCMGKGAKEREVNIEGPVVQQLQRWIVARADLPLLASDTVFVSLDKYWHGHRLQPKAIERIVRRCAKRAGLDSWGVHRFRVTYATQLYDDDTDIERIRILMGHNSIETTRRYLSVSRRMRGTRLKTHRQHDVLGTRGTGMPLWAQQLESQRRDD